MAYFKRDTMFILGCMVLLLHKHSHAGFTATFYRRSHVTGTVCNTMDIFELGKSTSVLQCGNECKLEPRCNSFFHTRLSGLCRGSRVIYTDFTTCEASPGAVYMVKDMTVGTPCTSDNDCPIQGTACTSGMCTCQPNMVADQSGTSCIAATTNLGEACRIGRDCYGDDVKCWDQQCTCRQGHYFAPAQRKCVAACSAGYGATFSLYRELTLDCPNHVTTLVSTMSRDCTVACLATGCTTVRYEASTAECTLDVCSETASRADYHAETGIDLYVRDCN